MEHGIVPGSVIVSTVYLNDKGVPLMWYVDENGGESEEGMTYCFTVKSSQLTTDSIEIRFFDVEPRLQDCRSLWVIPELPIYVRGSDVRNSLLLGTVKDYKRIKRKIGKFIILRMSSMNVTEKNKEFEKFLEINEKYREGTLVYFN